MDIKMLRIKEVLDSENKIEIVRDRLLKIYYDRPRAISSIARDSGVSAAVIDALVEGDKRRFTNASLIKVLNWVIDNEEESS